MDQDSSASGVLAVGCLVGALVLVGAGFLFFGVSSRTVVPTPGGASTGGPSPAAGVSTTERGYSLVPGTVVTGPNGVRTATVEVLVTPDWKLTDFKLSDLTVHSGAREESVRLISTLPSFPTEGRFTLTLELPALAEVEASGEDPGPQPPERVRMEIRAQSKSGFLGHRSAGSSRSVNFKVDGGLLRPFP